LVNGIWFDQMKWNNSRAARGIPELKNKLKVCFLWRKGPKASSAVAFGGSQLMESTCLMKSIDGAERKATSGAPSSASRCAASQRQQISNSFSSAWSCERRKKRELLCWLRRVRLFCFLIWLVMAGDQPSSAAELHFVNSFNWLHSICFAPSSLVPQRRQEPHWMRLIDKEKVIKEREVSWLIEEWKVVFDGVCWDENL